MGRMEMARSLARLETDFMNSLKLLFKRETLMPLLAMTFASAVCVAVVLLRIAWTGKVRYGFLVWNLFLAWLPLLLALRARENYRAGERPGWRFLGFSAAWLLFFPNAPYIFTDLIHLTSRYFTHFWVDLAVILSCALTGLILGFVSLYLMQSVVTRMLGRTAGWLFVAGATGLCSFGIYLGRFLRFNSWDVVAKPGKLYDGISSVANGQFAQQGHFAFLALFAAFIFITYVMLYALTHLPTAAQLSFSSDAPEAPET
jgi:uncharacterized membrane protein